MSIWAFICRYPRLIFFGLITAFFSAPGQTFLVSFFIPHMRDAFDWSHTRISLLYSIATFASALLLPVMGRCLDKFDLKRFTLLVGLGLSLGCFILSRSSGVLSVLIGFLFIRNLGQGTLSLISGTSMAKIFGGLRGKALGFAGLGYPLSEAVLPGIAAWWIYGFGWRSAWVGLSVFVLIVLLPAIFFLLKGRPDKKLKNSSEDQIKFEENSRSEVDDWKLKDVLRDIRFYLLLFPILLPPSFLTGLFFHQAHWIQWKGWTPEALAQCFILFALSRGITSFFAGPIVDKNSAKKCFPFVFIPIICGISGLLLSHSIFWAYFYLFSAGITLGFGRTVSGALWAELYGTKYLGSIKGIISSIIVFSTGLTPIILGVLFDQGIHAKWVIMAMVISFLFSMIGCILGLKLNQDSKI